MIPARVGAALALAALLAFSCASCSSGPAWKIEYQTGKYSLTGITAADASHIWTVGAGQVFFSQGGDWSKQADLPADFSAVCAGDASHVWASGSEGPEGSRTGVIYFFDGKNWSRQLSTKDQTISAVGAHGSANAWAAGWTGSGSNLYHFDGAAWTVKGVTGHVQDIHVVDERRALLVQEAEGGASEVMEFDGTFWKTYFRSGLPKFGVTQVGSKVWAVGQGEEGTNGAIINGIAWPRATSSTKYEVPDLLTKVAAADPSHVWAVGGTGYQGPIYLFDGKTWARQYSGAEPLFGVCTAGAKAWACGSLGGIYSIQISTP